MILPPLVFPVTAVENKLACFEDTGWEHACFVQLGFNLSNGVNDTLESSTILIYLETPKSIYTRR